MNQVVHTPEGPGVVKESRSTFHGGPMYFVAGLDGVYEGWYHFSEVDGLPEEREEDEFPDFPDEHKDDSEGTPFDTTKKSFYAPEDMDLLDAIDQGSVYADCPQCGGSNITVVFDADKAECDSCGYSDYPEEFDLEYADPAEHGEYEYRHASYETSLVAEGSWADVRTKASRIRSEGKVAIDSFHPASIHATVEGDHGTYSTSVFRIGAKGETDTKVTGWACDCDWGQWAYDRSQGSPYLGRMCSHALAVYWDMQSQHAQQKRQSSYSLDSIPTVVAGLMEHDVDMEDPDDVMEVVQEREDVDDIPEKWHTYHAAAHEDEDDEKRDSDDDDDEFGDHDWKPVDMGKDATHEADEDSDEELEALSEPPVKTPAQRDDENEDEASKNVVARFQAEMGGDFLSGNSGSGSGFDDFAAAAEAHLAKTAGRYYTPMEQDELINEDGFSDESIQKLNLANSSYLLP